ncbi:hypothetical protein A3A49_02455 [Candidatus Curtissbacteria bacterium RIFCSPLOWO2_01_FULL_38_11b]|uniref:Uncharacterized protein n=1 Tax=Candidatus Curtissbacteria bacterium RIFCSPLOWO2_01_FULL_38_11b TaxID=1797725 RepID=A0A1F5GYT5_9BACT|nr:MAG: hypothetical protein A3A49_02455 [Candidatus Curtissbacteria bacterium RIFCSPLOWO2_01_FULL_38_11b]
MNDKLKRILVTLCLFIALLVVMYLTSYWLSNHHAAYMTFQYEHNVLWIAALVSLLLSFQLIILLFPFHWMIKLLLAPIVGFISIVATYILFGGN